MKLPECFQTDMASCLLGEVQFMTGAPVPWWTRLSPANAQTAIWREIEELLGGPMPHGITLGG